MFKEKLYSGTFTNSTTTKTVTKVPGTETVATNLEKTNIVCNALLDFLTECGVEVSYEDESLIIYICGAPIIFHFPSTSLYYQHIYSGESVIVQNTSSSYASNTTLFKNDGTYSFKLCLIGEPIGFFGLFISNKDLSYNSGYNYIYFVNLQNTLSTNEYVGVGKGNLTGRFFVFKKIPLKFLGSSTTSESDIFKAGYVMSAEELNLPENQGKYPLIQSFSGIYKILNVYNFIQTNEINSYSVPRHSGGTFYKMNDEIYMAINNMGLVKCITT